MTMYRVQVVWAGAPVVGGGLSTFHFDEAAGTAAQAVTAVDTFIQAIKGLVSSQVTYQTVPDVGIVSETSGELVGAQTVGQQSGAGTGAGDVLPAANQALMRWLCNTFIDGRRIRGRTFIPGITESQSTGGLIAAALTTLNTAGAALVASPNANLVIWSRRNGLFSQVDTASAWSSFAVLRSRRD